jgi:hypothetical protein
MWKADKKGQSTGATFDRSCAQDQLIVLNVGLERKSAGAAMRHKSPRVDPMRLPRLSI